MKIEVTIAFFFSLVYLAGSSHLILGDTTDRNASTLLYHTVAKYYGIPLIKRVKSVFYNSPEQKVINRIVVYDNLLSQASATVTAGGVGYTYVNIRLKSERGKGLDYDIGIYTQLIRVVFFADGIGSAYNI